MQTQLAYGMTHPEAPAGTRPAACAGVSDADLEHLASEILKDYLDGAP